MVQRWVTNSTARPWPTLIPSTLRVSPGINPLAGPLIEQFVTHKNRILHQALFKARTRVPERVTRSLVLNAIQMTFRADVEGTVGGGEGGEGAFIERILGQSLKCSVGVQHRRHPLFTL